MAQTVKNLVCNVGVKVKVTQLSPILCDPMDYSVHGILQARILEWVAIPFSRGIVPTQGSNSSLLHCRQILYQLSHCGSLRYNPWVREIPWRRKWQPTPAIMTGESHGQKSLGGCSPLGCKESNMTEWQTHRYALYSELFLHVFVCVCVYVCVWWSCKERTVINILRTRRPW